MTGTAAFLGLRAPELPIARSLAADAVIHGALLTLTWIFG